MKRFFFLLLFVPSISWAQTPQSAELPKQSPVNTGNSSSSVCTYSEAAKIARAHSAKPEDLVGIDGSTEISLTINNGQATDVVVTHSSGNIVLDNAMVECARSHQYKQAMSVPDGQHTDLLDSALVKTSMDWKIALKTDMSDRQTTGPMSIGAMHICAGYYPQNLMRAGIVGSTELIFNISTQGKVVDVIVAASSDNDDLDNASVTCAKQWLYRPATQNGNLVEVPWKATVIYSLRPGSEPWIAPLLTGPLHNCLTEYSPTTQQLEGITGMTVLIYKLISGEVSDVSLSHTSGNSELDKQAIDCVRSWRFSTTVPNGQPATHQQTAIIDWREALGNSSLKN